VPPSGGRDAPEAAARGVFVSLADALLAHAFEVVAAAEAAEAAGGPPAAAAVAAEAVMAGPLPERLAGVRRMLGAPAVLGALLCEAAPPPPLPPPFSPPRRTR
jgi:hypothetical protein